MHGRGTVSENLRWFVIRGHCRGFVPRFLGKISCNLRGIVSVALVALLGDFVQEFLAGFDPVLLEGYGKCCNLFYTGAVQGRVIG